MSEENLDKERQAVKDSMREQQKNDGFDEMKPVYEGGPEGMPSNMLYSNNTYNDEYKVGHNKPPLFLVVLYILVLVWCSISWIPFYGY